MKLNLSTLAQKTVLPLLVVSLFAFGTTLYQTVLAHRLVTETVQAYAPRIEKQAVSIIIEALPQSEKGSQAAYLAQALAKNTESQYQALARAVQNQASTLTQQAFGWGVMSILALITFLESRRKVPSAAS